MKPLMKTYGKYSRKVAAWISPDVRKQAFDSTASDGDAFDVKPAKAPRQRKTTRRAAHTARAKAKLHLIEDSTEEENIPPASCPQPAQQSNTREKRTKGSGSTAVPAAKKKAVLCVTNTDEESISWPSPPRPQAAQQSKTTSRRSRRVSVAKAVVRQKGQQVPKTSESEDSTAECHKNSVQMKADSSVHLRSVGQFVTRRRRCVAPKPRLQKAILSILNSSDDFTPGVFGSRTILQCSRRKTRKRAVLPPFLVSSAENSLNSASFANPLREISLNELANHSSGPSPRKPIFCSTPSAGPFNQRPRIKTVSLSDQSTSLTSMSVSCIGALQVDLDSPGQPSPPPHSSPPCSSPPCSSPPITIDSGGNIQSGLCDQGPSGDLFMEAKSTNNTSSRIQEISSHSGDIVTKDDGELPSVNLLSTDGESQSCFVSAAGSLEWLIEALKEKCLTEHCTVQLERLCNLTVTQLCSQSSFSPCLGRSGSDVSASDDCERSETAEKAEALVTILREKCLTHKPHVEVKRLSLPQLKDSSLQLKDRKRGSPTEVSGSASDEQTNNHYHTQSDTKVTSDKEEVCKKSDDVPPKRKKTSLCPKEKNRKRTSVGRSGTTRKACVSGLSVSRWKNKDSMHRFGSRAAQTGGNKAVDCSINELMSAARQPKVLMGTTMNLSTPVRVSRLNLSSLLADLTPNTHTWSQLKAALSIHRKTTVAFTPRRSRLMSQEELVDVSQDLFATPSRTPLPKRLMSQLVNCSALTEDTCLSDAEKVYAECRQQSPLPWEQCILPQRMKQCVKIGEGTFGEVFSTTNAAGDKVALKIIPLEGSEKVNGEDQKTFGEILHEIIISKELSSLKEKASNQTHGFIGLNDLHCVQGCYPPEFLNAWDAFDEQKGSENDRPDFFENDQLFIILEFEFGGADLENSNGTLQFLGVAMSILHQVTAALAVAEQELHFEHRDLHWGNVLVKATEQKKASFLLNGAVHTVETKGVLVRIIDYSLSRLEIDDLTVSCDISNDEELFMGQGDYQFEIYRLMRQENGNCWSSYHPRTNVLWLHYLCAKLLAMKYQRSRGRGVKDMREMLTRFHDNVLQYSSATEVLEKCFSSA